MASEFDDSISEPPTNSVDTDVSVSRSRESNPFQVPLVVADMTIKNTGPEETTLGSETAHSTSVKHPVEVVDRNYDAVEVHHNEPTSNNHHDEIMVQSNNDESEHKIQLEESVNKRCPDDCVDISNENRYTALTPMIYNGLSGENNDVQKVSLLDSNSHGHNSPSTPNVDESDSRVHVAKKKRTESDTLKAKTINLDSTIKQTSEIMLVLAGMGQLRGGKSPTELEKRLMLEARKKLAYLAEKVSPNYLVPRDGIGSMIENLGLNKLKEQKKGSEPRKSIFERAQETMKKIELDKQLAAASHIPSTSLSRLEHAYSNAAIPVSSLTTGQVPLSGVMKPPNTTIKSIPATQHMSSIPVMPQFPIAPFVSADPRKPVGSMPSVVLSQAPMVTQPVGIPLKTQIPAVPLTAPQPQPNEVQRTGVAPSNLTSEPITAQGSEVTAPGHGGQQSVMLVQEPSTVTSVQEHSESTGQGYSKAKPLEEYPNQERLQEYSKTTINHEHIKTATLATVATSDISHVGSAGRKDVAAAGNQVKNDTKLAPVQLYTASMQLEQKSSQGALLPTVACNLLDTPQSANHIESLGVHANHADMARTIQKILQSAPQEIRQVELPSKAYMSAPISCQICKVNVMDIDTILVCDSCEKGVHLKCLQAYNQKGIPNGDWHCPPCIIASSGRPLPPKYGRVGRSNINRKADSAKNNHQSLSVKRTGVSDPRVPQQATALANGLNSVETAGDRELTQRQMPSGLGKVSMTVKNNSLIPGIQTNQGTAISSSANNSLKTSEIQPPQKCGPKERNVNSEYLQQAHTSNILHDAERTQIQNEASGCSNTTLIQNGERSEKRMKEKGISLNPNSSSEGIPENGSKEEDAYHVEWVGEMLQTKEGRTYYQACSVRGTLYKLHDYALFRPETPNVPPYIARLQLLWEDDNTKSKWVQVNWCYYPTNIPQGVALPTAPEKVEVYESNHGDTNLVGSIQGPCQVLSLEKYQEEISRRNTLKGSSAVDTLHPLFLCKWFYDAPKGNFHPFV